METIVTIITGMLISLFGFLLMKHDYFTATKEKQKQMRKGNRNWLFHTRRVQRARAGMFFFFFGIVIIVASVAAR